MNKTQIVSSYERQQLSGGNLIISKIRLIRKLFLFFNFKRRSGRVKTETVKFIEPVNPQPLVYNFKNTIYITR